MTSAGGNRDQLIARLNGRSIVLVGMMGAGKTSIGKRLAAALGFDFVDADVEIETAAGMTIAEIFARHGESYFRDGERRVVSRLLKDSQRVVATGGGAFMNPATRERIADRGVAVWLKADAEILLRRVRKRGHRPLLSGQDPEQTLRQLIEDRYPVYALADLVVESRDGPHDLMVSDVLDTLERGLASVPRLQAPPPASPAVARIQASALPEPAEAAGRARESVAVELGGRRYEVVVGPGLIAEAGARIARLAPGASCAIVADEAAAKSRLPALETSLSAMGVRHWRVIAPAGEAARNWDVVSRVCDGIAAGGATSGDLVLALGDASLGEVAGFAAAVVHRGMRLVSAPTTLPAQIESAVAGGYGILTRDGRDVIGARHAPVLALADTDALAERTLEDFRSGYAFIVKYALAQDAVTLSWLERRWGDVFSRGPALARAIAAAGRARAALLAREETDRGDATPSNLGQAFARAIEALAGSARDAPRPGEALSVGMCGVFGVSARMGVCAADDARRAEAHLRAVGLPTRLRDVAGGALSPEAVVDAMRRRRQPPDGSPAFILTRGIGQCFASGDAPDDEILAYLRAEPEP